MVSDGRSDLRVTPERAASVLAAAQKAAATRQASIVAREDCAKVLQLLRDDEGARLLRSISDAAYASIVAQASGPARGPLRPPGKVIDLDATDRKSGA